MPTKIPGQSGFAVERVSSMDERVIGTFTDSNHLNAIQGSAPSKYDKDIISLYTQSDFYANDFLNMITKSTPFTIDSNSDSWTWKVGVPYKYNKIVAVPAATDSNPTPGIDESIIELIFERPSFQKNDVISADKRYGDALIVVSDPQPVSTGSLYALKLTGSNVTSTTSADKRFLVPGQTYEQIDQITGEFTQDLGGLDIVGQELTLVDSLSAGWGLKHSITSWADQRVLRSPLAKDGRGRDLDLIVFKQYALNEMGKKQVIGFRWEPFIESMLRKKMLDLKVSRMIWGKGGYSTENTGKQEVRKHTEGIYHKMKRDAHTVEFNRGGFSLGLLRDTFGDLFYRRVDMKNRRVKLFTNEAGIALFRQANKEDLFRMGLTIQVDIKDYKSNPMVVHPDFDLMYSMESGVVEVSHLRELDLPYSQADFDLNKRSAPIFFVFDLTNPDGGLNNNIRTVRNSGQPGMTWGYIDGRRHHLGFAASQGMSSASMEPGYQMWYEDREDVFIEDMSRVVVIEETGSPFNL